jgi:hypothetical protein
MRDEDPLDRQLEEGPQRRLEVVESRRSDPTGRAEAQRLVGRARLGAGAEQDVADDECALRRDPVDDLALAGRAEAPHSAGKLVPDLERIGYLDAAVLKPSHDRRRRPHAPACIPGGEERRDEGVVGLRRRVERVEGENAVVALDGDAADLLARVLVLRGSARDHRSALATGHAPLLVFDITVNLGVE